jgi:hypothetical protein
VVENILLFNFYEAFVHSRGHEFSSFPSHLIVEFGSGMSWTIDMGHVTIHTKYTKEIVPLRSDQSQIIKRSIAINVDLCLLVRLWASGVS